MNSIKTLTTKLMTDSNLILTAELLEIKGDFAILFFEKKIIRRKIKKSFDGSSYVLPYGSYSMCPAFNL